MLAIAGAALGGLGSIAAGGLALIPGVGPFLVAAIEFFKTRAGKFVGFLLLLAIVYGLGMYRGDKMADAKCEAGNLRVELQRKELALKIATDTGNDVKQRLEAEEGRLLEANKKVKGLEDDIKKRNETCRAVTEPDRRRLRGIPTR